ncbi:hypothetical protein GCM10010276_23120 [Streptomyces longisporus]|uniref:Uncharacterized protein n=1 Tax=Streptomyces longisporus TaxID=1948 RepID=A0ABN3LI76_STRLO
MRAGARAVHGPVVTHSRVRVVVTRDDPVRLHRDLIGRAAEPYFGSGSASRRIGPDCRLSH